MALEHPLPSLDSILQVLDIPAESVLNVYPYGSHLYGLARPNSDWDIIVIVKDFVGPLKKTETHKDALLPGFEEAIASSQDLDITVYHYRYWQELLDNNAIRILLCTGIPKEMIIKETVVPRWRLEYMRMKLDTYAYIKRREQVSQRFWAHKSYDNSKKQLLHVLRVLEVAQQIMDTGKIQDYSWPANQHWIDCKQETAEFSTHQQLMNWYRARKDPLFLSLKDRWNVYKTKADHLTSCNAYSLPVLNYLQFQAKNNLNKLVTELSINHTTISYPTTLESATGNFSESNPMILLERTFHSPRTTAANTCYRAVITTNILSSSSLDSATTSPESCGFLNWRLLALAPKKYWRHGSDEFTENDDKFVGELEWSTTKLYEKLQGFGILLFHYDPHPSVAGPPAGSHAFHAVVCHSGIFASQYKLRPGIESEDLDAFICRRFWECFASKNYQFPDPSDPFTYQFIFHPDEEILKLEAIVNVTTLQEVPDMWTMASRFSWAAVQETPIKWPVPNPKNPGGASKNVEHVTNMLAVSTLSMLTHEGFLAVDGKGTKVEFWLPQYFCLVEQRSPFARRYRTHHFLKIARAVASEPNGPENFCKYYPQWAGWLDYISSMLRKIYVALDSMYKPLANIEDPIAFQREVEKICTTGNFKQIFWMLKKYPDAYSLFTDRENVNTGGSTKLLRSYINSLNLLAEAEETESAM